MAVRAADASLSQHPVAEVAAFSQTQTVSTGKKQLDAGVSCQWVLLDLQQQLVIWLCDDLTEVTTSTR
jgi:hypothetical protein